jgi:hypothetical protein
VPKTDELTKGKDEEKERREEKGRELKRREDMRSISVFCHENLRFP